MEAFSLFSTLKWVQQGERKRSKAIEGLCSEQPLLSGCTTLLETSQIANCLITWKWQKPNLVLISSLSPSFTPSLSLNPYVVLCGALLYMHVFVCDSSSSLSYLIPSYFLSFPPLSLGKLLKRWQMASWVTFADIQGSAFISVLQFTLVNEIHLCCWDGLVASLSHTYSPSLSLSPSIPVPKWMPSVRGNGKVAHGFAAALKCHAEEKVFNGLSVAFPALTCQVIRNLSLTLSVSLLPTFFSRSSAPRGPWHTTNYLLYQSESRMAWKRKAAFKMRRYHILLLLNAAAYF